MSIPKARLVLVLLVALLVPAVSRAEVSAQPVPAPAVSSPVAGSAACAAQDALARILAPEDVQHPGNLSGTLLPRLQEKGGPCSPTECEDFCDGVCAPCGGVPVGQCNRGLNGVCRSVCNCNIC
jgi:hypothetical protein